MTRWPGWRPPYDYAAARPTFIDAWPDEWRALAPPLEIVPLSREEGNALGAQITGCQHWFVPVPHDPLRDVAHRLDRAIARQERSSFIRLTSRSPKDSLYALRHGMRIRDGASALALIVEGSVRCAADLRMALDAGESVGIVVRRWIDFPPWAEYRCFVRSGTLAGACQYHPGGDPAQAVGALSAAIDRIVATAPCADLAVDLAVDLAGLPPFQAGAALLDINPLNETTDLVLFGPTIDDLDGSLRYRCPLTGIVRTTTLKGLA